MVIRSPHHKERRKKENIYSQQAERIYSAYPNKADRKNSIKSIIKLLKAGVPPETLLGATENYKDYIERKGIERDYIIQSNNFFGRASRWEEWKDRVPSKDEDPEFQGPAYHPFVNDI